MPRPSNGRGRRRGSGLQLNSIMFYVMVTLCVGVAIVVLAGAWLLITWLFTPFNSGSVPYIPTESFTPVYETTIIGRGNW